MQVCFNQEMRKATALARLGPTLADVAREIGVSPSAVSQWPEVLPKRIEDRVLAALARRHLAPELLGDVAAPESVPAARAAQEQAHAG